MNKDQTPVRSKLFKLKKWLTVPDAARHLSILFDEEVSEADVLQLALDRHLKLSVNFVNNADAKCGAKFLPFEEWEKDFREKISLSELKKNPFKGPNGELVFHVPGTNGVISCEAIEDKKTQADAWSDISINQFNKAIDVIVYFQKKISKKYGGKVPPDLSTLNEKVITLEGVYDLPFIGSETLDIEHKYQQLTGGPEINGTCLDGAFVETEDGKICQLQERFPDQDGPLDNDKISPFEQKMIDAGTTTKERLAEKKKERAKRPYNHPDNYYPAGCLPYDSVLVVRTQALIDLHERISQKESPNIVEASFLNNKHAFYTEELKIAVEAWTELYEKNPPEQTPQGGHKNYIKRWLEENHSSLTGRAKERITTVVNPNQKGGATRTSGNFK